VKSTETLQLVRTAVSRRSWFSNVFCTTKPVSCVGRIKPRADYVRSGCQSLRTLQ